MMEKETTLQKRIVFPDTNLFLHYPPMREIDWFGLANASSVELVVCMTVINELDAKKSDSRLSSRAERAIREIKDAKKANGVIRDGITLSIFNREIRNSEFAESLSPDSSDDRIVHFARIYREENPYNPVAIATADMGMELRADAGGVDVIVFGSELRLENPLDEVSRKYREAVTENNALKNRLPKLSIGLSLPNGAYATPHTVIFNLPTERNETNIEAEMASIRDRYPKNQWPDLNTSSGSRYESSLASLMAGMADEKEWQRYNSDLDDFYEEYNKHLALVVKIQEIQHRSFWFDLWLANDGNSLASDNDVLVTFPERLKVFEKGAKLIRQIESLPEPPKPPNIPSAFASLDLRGLGLNHPRMIAQRPSVQELFQSSRNDERSPKTVRTNNLPNIVEIQLGKLKHGYSIRLGTFLVVFPSVEEIKPFGARCVISCADLPNKIDCKLPFRVHVGMREQNQIAIDTESNAVQSNDFF